MSDAAAIDLVELLVVLDPPRTYANANDEANAIVNVLVRAGYQAQVTDLRGEGE